MPPASAPAASLSAACPRSRGPPVRTVIGEILPWPSWSPCRPSTSWRRSCCCSPSGRSSTPRATSAGFVVGVAAVLGGPDRAGRRPCGLSHRLASGPGARPALLLALGSGCWWWRCGSSGRARAAGETAPLPTWMDGHRRIRPGEVARRRAAPSGPPTRRTSPSALASAVTIATAGLGAGQAVGVVAVYTVVASLGVAAPIVAMLVLGDRSDEVLAGWQAWLDRNNTAMMAVHLPDLRGDPRRQGDRRPLSAGRPRRADHRHGRRRLTAAGYATVPSAHERPRPPTRSRPTRPGPDGTPGSPAPGTGSRSPGSRPTPGRP